MERQAELAGLAPTIERLVGLDATLGQAHPFDTFVRPGPVWDTDGWPERPTRTVVMEATRGPDEPTDRWNNLAFRRGIRAGGWTLFEPELPALRANGGSALSASELVPAILQGILVEMLESWDLSAPPHRSVEMSDQTVEALRALGYLEPD